MKEVTTKAKRGSKQGERKEGTKEEKEELRELMYGRKGK